MSVEETVAFLSPQSKLVRFFHRSRDKWKTKCKEAKRENKSLKYRLAVMTESRNRWKAEARGSGKTAPAQPPSVAEEVLK
jgi:recombinational DNA repair protein (RecF pathway)